MKGEGLLSLLGSSCLALILASMLFVTACGKPTPSSVATPDKVYRIGITQIATHPSLDACRQGLIDQMAEEGFAPGTNVEYDYLNPDRDMSLVASIAQKFVSENVDLILSISTPSTQACVAAAEGTSIPIIFGCVTDPVAAGLVESWENPDGNVTGVSDWTEVAPQLELVTEICPDVEKLGTIYNAGEVNSLVQVDELENAAPEFGITEIIEATVASTTEVITAARSLMGRVDAIWIPTDNTVGTALEAVVKVCEDNGVPLFIANPSHVGRGVIAAIGIDPYFLGREAGKIAARVLRGENPADIPVKKCPLSDLRVDLSAAEKMGATVPQSVLARATEIMDE